MKSLVIGRTILVCIGYRDANGSPALEGEPVLRPAIVVRVWSDSCCNAQVLLDGLNDMLFADNYAPGILTASNCEHGTKWATSTCSGERIGEWRWM